MADLVQQHGEEIEGERLGGCPVGPANASCVLTRPPPRSRKLTLVCVYSELSSGVGSTKNRVLASTAIVPNALSGSPDFAAANAPLSATKPIWMSKLRASSKWPSQ
jgi:hypothetical protein